MAYGQTHSETLPTVGVTAGETYATMINDCLEEMRATLDAKVTPAGIDVNADLSMRSGSTRYGLTDVHRMALYQQPSLLAAATYPASVYASADGDLYYNNASGDQVQVTSGSGVAATPGSITGLAGSASLVWNAGSSDFEFYVDSSVPTFADIVCNDVLLWDGSGNYLRQTAAAMVTDYTMTWPAAVPAADGTLLQFTIGGVASFANTGLAAVSLAANASFTVSGTGTYKHGNRILVIPASLGSQSSGDPHVQEQFFINMGNTTTPWVVPIPLPVGASISQVSFYVNAAAGTKSLALFSRTMTTTTTHETTTTAATGNNEHGLAISPEVVVTAGSAYYAAFTAGNAADTLYHIEVHYNQP